MKKNKQILVIIFLVVYSIMRITIISKKTTISGDSAFSLFGAANNLDYIHKEIDKGDSGIFKDTKTAREWQHIFFEPRSRRFVDVKQDHLLRDIHPPLYAFILNSLFISIDTIVLIPLVLNFIFELLLFLVLYKNSRKLGVESSIILIGLFFLTFHFVFFSGFFIIRTYMLVSLLAAISFFCAISILENEKKVSLYVIQGVTIGLGVCLHYQFLILSAILYSLQIALAIYYKKDTHKNLISILTASIVVFGILPEIIEHLTNKSVTFGFSPHYYEILINSFSKIFFHHNIQEISIYLGVALSLLTLIFFSFAINVIIKLKSAKHQISIWLPILFFTSMALLFVLKKIPQHSFDADRYFLIHIALIFPFLLLFYQKLIFKLKKHIAFALFFMLFSISVARIYKSKLPFTSEKTTIVVSNKISDLGLVVVSSDPKTRIKFITKPQNKVFTSKSADERWIVSHRFKDIVPFPSITPKGFENN